jgi:hypothetical protein
MSYRSNLVDIEVTLRRETPLAYGFANPNGGDIIWVPKSQCEFEGGDPPTCKGTLTMEDWKATEKGLT